MNHRWSIKINGNDTIEKKTHSNRVRVIHLYGIYECVNCGLRRGIHKIGWNYKNTVYYDKHEKKLLSENKLPHTCNRQNDFLFSKKEFML